MNISLSPELERFIADEVGSGRYQTVNEVIGEGLRLLKERQEAEHQQFADLRKEIAIGIEQADQGKVAPFNAREVLDRVRQQSNRLSKPN